ncbi:MAG TPA: hypothetical protein VLA54_05380 [Acidimicrobiia bacterium]|nr:hypothetical protein [Acidimicrobiia bacterium]
MAALAVYAPRYQIVAREAGTAFDPDRVAGSVVIETLAGNATTEFGAPGMVAEEDRVPMSGRAMSRMLALVGAAWVVFDQVVAAAPAELRKGPRGGGRDRDQIVDHVLAAEMAYLRKLGVKHKAPAPRDGKMVAAIRDETLRRIGEGGSGEPLTERGWPVRYAARRIAWHVLDHAWEIEDRS